MPTGNATGFVQTVALIGTTPVMLSVPLVGSSRISPSVVLPAAIPGALSTRTNNTQGIFSATANHGLAGTELLGLGWDGGSCRDVVINSHDSTTVTFTSYSGSNLPAQDTVMYLAVMQEITSIYLPGSTSMVGLQITGPTNGWCNLFDMGGTSKGVNRLSTTITTAAPYFWPQYSGQTVPFTQLIRYADCYNFGLGAGAMFIDAILL